MKKISISELAKLLELQPDDFPAGFIEQVAPIDEAKEGELTFLGNPKYESFLYQTSATAVLVPLDFQPRQPVSTILLPVPNVHDGLGRILKYFEKEMQLPKGVSPMAFVSSMANIDESAKVSPFAYVANNTVIGENCIIYPQVFIGENVRIGSNTILYPGVKIYQHTQIGKNCHIHANAVIGSDGFGFSPQPDGSYQKIPHIGRVIIEDNVEIGANTVIDRASIGATIIREGTKLDNLIQVAHGAKIGQHTVIAAQAGIAGSTQIGNNCQIGGQAGFVGHIQVADRVQVQAQSGVAASINKEGSKVYGYPAISYRDYLKAYSLFRKLPEIEKRISILEAGQNKKA